MRHILVEMRKSSTCSGGDGLERKAGSQGPKLASVEEAGSTRGKVADSGKCSSGQASGKMQWFPP